MMREAIINGKAVEYDSEEFEVVDGTEYSDLIYLHYIGDGSKPVHNPKGNITCECMEIIPYIMIYFY